MRKYFVEERNASIAVGVHQKKRFNIRCIKYLQGGLTTASCRVRCGRVQKGNVRTGEPEDPVIGQSPGACCSVLCESMSGS